MRERAIISEINKALNERQSMISDILVPYKWFHIPQKAISAISIKEYAGIWRVPKLRIKRIRIPKLLLKVRIGSQFINVMINEDEQIARTTKNFVAYNLWKLGQHRFINNTVASTLLLQRYGRYNIAASRIAMLLDDFLLEIENCNKECIETLLKDVLSITRKYRPDTKTALILKQWTIETYLYSLLLNKKVSKKIYGDMIAQNKRSKRLETYRYWGATIRGIR